MRRSLVGAGLALLAASAWPDLAHAGAEPGSGFGPFSLAASAPGFQLREDDPSLCYRSAAADNGCEGVVPEAVSTLRSGPIGHGLAAVVWPGGIAAGAGSLLVTAGGSSVPPQATLLNDPVRADAYTNVGPTTQSYDAAPGTTMTATALATKVSARAAVEGSTAVAVGTAGSSTSHSAVELTGVRTATAVAHSEVKDVSLGGVLHIASVVSDASATTDGEHATAKGTTTASGVSVGGIPVTVDDRGVHAQGTGAATDAEQAAVNSALKGVGMQIALGAPDGVPQGGSVAYNAQSLVIVFTNATGFTTTVVLGGANVSVAASPGFAYPTSSGPPVVPGVLAPAGTQPGYASPGSAVLAPAVGGSGPTTGRSGPSPVLAATDLPEPGPIRTRTALLVLTAAALLAAGFRRLPDEVLRVMPVECRTEEAT
jgi:hypothetical protein